MADYLLDTNFLIYLADERSNVNNRVGALRKLQSKLEQEDSTFLFRRLSAMKYCGMWNGRIRTNSRTWQISWHNLKC